MSITRHKRCTGFIFKLFYNVNFPPVLSGDVLGISVASQGRRLGTNFGVTPHNAPSGRRFVWIHGGPQDAPTAPGADAAANLDGYISVTPMRADLTAHDMIADLKDLLE